MTRIDLVERVITQRFRVVRFAAGYDTEQVDDLLDTLALQIRDEQDPAETERFIHQTKLSSTRWRGGYSFSDVDDFLLQVTQKLRALPSSPAQ